MTKKPEALRGIMEGGQTEKEGGDGSGAQPYLCKL
jgi:hypothetical protein